MQVDVEIDLRELRELLVDKLRERFGLDIGKISVVSHNQPRIVIEADGLIDAVEFRHRPIP